MIAPALVAIPAAIVVIGARRGRLGLALVTMGLVGVVGAVAWSLVLLAI